LTVCFWGIKISFIKNGVIAIYVLPAYPIFTFTGPRHSKYVVDKTSIRTIRVEKVLVFFETIRGFTPTLTQGDTVKPKVYIFRVVLKPLYYFLYYFKSI
jgi:hypothetical protein